MLFEFYQYIQTLFLYSAEWNQESDLINIIFWWLQMLKNWSIIIIHNKSVNEETQERGGFAGYGLFFLAVISLTKINTSYLPWSQVATAYTRDNMIEKQSVDVL